MKHAAFHDFYEMLSCELLFEDKYFCNYFGNFDIAPKRQKFSFSLWLWTVSR